jgi:hypothetical protein
MQEPALSSAGLDLDFSSVAGAPTPSERLVPAAIGRGRCELSLTGYTAAKRMEMSAKSRPPKHAALSGNRVPAAKFHLPLGSPPAPRNRAHHPVGEREP